MRIKKRSVSKSSRNFIFNRYKTCCKCGSTENLTIDHILPLAIGGNNGRRNLQTLCYKCNQEKGIQMIDYRDTPIGVKVIGKITLPDNPPSRKGTPLEQVRYYKEENRQLTEKLLSLQKKVNKLPSFIKWIFKL